MLLPLQVSDVVTRTMAHRFDLVRNLRKVVLDSYATFENKASFPLCSEYDGAELKESRELGYLEVCVCIFICIRICIIMSKRQRLANVDQNFTSN